MYPPVRRTRIIANDFMDQFALHFYDRLENGDILVVSKIEYAEVKPGQPRVFDEGIVMNPELCQELMEELWRHGFRPREGKGSAGSLKATEYHLEDMRKQCDRLFALVEAHMISVIEKRD